MVQNTRFFKSFDTMSQFVNITFLRRHNDTTGNESTSGRCFREAMFGKNAGHWSWVYSMYVIDSIFCGIKMTKVVDIANLHISEIMKEQKLLCLDSNLDVKIDQQLF